MMLKAKYLLYFMVGSLLGLYQSPKLSFLDNSQAEQQAQEAQSGPEDSFFRFILRQKTWDFLPKKPVRQPHHFTAQSSIDPLAKAYVSSPLAGCIQKIVVASGTPVQQGDILAYAQAPLLKEYFFQYQQTVDDLRRLQQIHQQYQTLWDLRTISKQSMLQSEKNLEQARNHQYQAQQRLNRLGFDNQAIEQLQQKMLQTTDKTDSNLFDDAIKANAEGLLQWQQVAVGQCFQAQEVLFAILDQTPVVVIPSEALHFQGAAPYVWLQRQQQIMQQNVHWRRLTADHVWLDNGVLDGDILFLKTPALP